MGIELYGRATSYNVQKVLWLLDEINLQYRHIECGGRFGGLDTEKFRALNPFGKIPIITDGGKIIRESNTILRYLAGCYGKKLWWRQDPVERAQYEAWMDWSIEKMEPAFVGVFWGYYRTSEKYRDWPTINRHRNECLKCLAYMNEQLANHSYICGAKISLADISLGVYMYRLVHIDLTLELPPFTDKWYQRLQQRPGYQKWVMSDFSELKGRTQY